MFARNLFSLIKPFTLQNAIWSQEFETKAKASIFYVISHDIILIKFSV